MPWTGRSVERRGRTTTATCPSPVPATTTAVRDGQRGGAEAAHGEAVAVERRRAVPTRPIAGQHDPGRSSSSTPMATSTTWSSAEDVALAAPWSSNSSDTAARGSNDERVVPAQLRERGVERVAGVLLGRVAQAALEQLEVVRRRSSVVPEVEQAPGDDVALDLGAAAVDRRRPRVEELRCASVRSSGRRRASPRRRGLGDEIEDGLLGGGQEHLVDRRLRAERARRRPAGAAWRATGRGTRRRAGSPRRAGPGRASPAGAASSSCWSRRWRNAARCHSAVLRSYGSRSIATAQPWPSSPSVRSNGTSTSSKKTSQNSGSPCIVSIGPHGDAGRVHVDEERGDAPVGRLERAGAREQHAPLRRTGPGSSTPSGR